MRRGTTATGEQPSRGSNCSGEAASAGGAVASGEQLSRVQKDASYWRVGSTRNPAECNSKRRSLPDCVTRESSAGLLMCSRQRQYAWVHRFESMRGVPCLPESSDSQESRTGSGGAPSSSTGELARQADQASGSLMSPEGSCRMFVTIVISTIAICAKWTSA